MMYISIEVYRTAVKSSSIQNKLLDNKGLTLLYRSIEVKSVRKIIKSIKYNVSKVSSILLYIYTIALNTLIMEYIQSFLCIEVMYRTPGCIELNAAKTIDFDLFGSFPGFLHADTKRAQELARYKVKKIHLNMN